MKRLLLLGLLTALACQLSVSGITRAQEKDSAEKDSAEAISPEDLTKICVKDFWYKIQSRFRQGKNIPVLEDGLLHATAKEEVYNDLKVFR